MTRCEYDTIFQRVFCITLVAIAFTFTVILTNVFIDIDGLLSRKDKVKTFNNMEPFSERKEERISPNAIIPSFKIPPEKNYEEESEDSYRSKRSLESQNFLFHMKNPKMKSILTSRLATLLEELDEEETPNNKEDNSRKKFLNQNEIIQQYTNVQKAEGDKSSKLVEGGKRTHDVAANNENILHLAMHNILLQGIIGHMDLNDVYKKIHHLVNNFKPNNDGNEFGKPNTHTPSFDELKETLENIPKNKVLEISLPQKPYVNEENQFFEEMAKCDKLQNDIAEKINLKMDESPDTKKDVKIPNVMIKTIIDITSKNNNNSNNSKTKENVKGIIQLIYNGKAVNFNRMDDDITCNQKSPKTESTIKATNNDRTSSESVINEVVESLNEKYQVENNSESYLSNLIGSYIKKNPERVESILKDVQTKHKYKTKRYKRQIKIRYQDDDFKTEKQIFKPADKSDKDELYIEIETHFDSKGLKGEKKKKLIRKLIEKIQEAIHSDIDNIAEEKVKKHKHYHVKKRTQNPIDRNRTLFVNKVLIPYDPVVERQSDPISKAVIANQAVPLIADKYGENWKRTYLGPGFLTVSKSLNSAELGEVDVDYNKVKATNGIPQRLQKPLNVVSEETGSPSTYFDLGDLKFFIKNLDGTGLSIGFNQYTDEPPDPNTMKLFNSIENIISTYHQSHEDIDTNNQEQKTYHDSSGTEHHDIFKRNANNNEHVLIRRCVKELNNKDYHSNEYKIIFDGNYLPFDNYEEIIEDRNKKVAISINKDKKELKNPKAEAIAKKIDIEALPELLSDNIFYKKLRPSEILNLATLLNRKKRAMSVKKISNLKNKIKLNKFLNTNKKGTKRVMLKKKRNKRQIDKIRIIATDTLAKARQSAENIVFVSNENILADRAIMKEVRTPDTFSEMDMGEAKYVNNYPNIVPYSYDDSMRNVFERKLRHNSLMSKYPHVFMEEISPSNEDDNPIMINKIKIKPYKHLFQHNVERTTQVSTTESVLPKLEEIIGDLPGPKQNYKLTVRIMPKNISNINSGFKEVHTSINKSFNKDGMVYSSLVNVSEISKIENLQNLTDTTVPPFSLYTKPFFETKLDEQQKKMEILLRQHKKRIDDQLEDLKKERLNLEALTPKTLQQKHESLEISTEKSTFLPQIAKYDIEKLLKATLKHLKTQSDAPIVESTTQSITIATTTKEPTTENQMIESMQKNENLTNEILHLINKNTELLKTFLEKLANRLPVKRASEEQKPTFDDTNKYWRPYQLPFSLPSKNGTNGPIPFIYAFQNPFNVKQNIPIASVLYHGQIYTNNLRQVNGIEKFEKSNPEIGNETQTRYFIDDLENDYKMTPLKKTKEVEAPPVISKNAAKVQ